MGILKIANAGRGPAVWACTAQSMGIGKLVRNGHIVFIGSAVIEQGGMVLN